MMDVDAKNVGVAGETSIDASRDCDAAGVAGETSADDSRIPETEEALRGRLRTLEQRELAQMRQSAILQRRLDQLERELAALRDERGAAGSASSSPSRAVGAAAVADVDETKLAAHGREAEATRTLELELQGRLRAAAARQSELEAEVKAERAERVERDADLAFWHACGQELLGSMTDKSTLAAGAADAASGGKEAVAAAGDLDAEEESLEALEALQARAEALRSSRAALDARLAEMRRLADTSQHEQLRLRSQHDALAAKRQRQLAAAADADARAAAADEAEKRLRLEAGALTSDAGEAAVPPLEHAAPSIPAIPEEDREVAALRKQVLSLHSELDSLRAAGARLRTKLGPEDAPDLEAAASATASRAAGARPARATSAAAAAGGAGAAGAVAAAGSGAGPFGDAAAWLASQLFRSMLVRRFFCVQLVLLYGWVLFLLTWMSSE